MTIPSRSELNERKCESLKNSEAEVEYQFFLDKLERELVRATDALEDDIRIKYRNDYYVNHEEHDQLYMFDTKNKCLNDVYSMEVLKLLRSKGYSYTRVSPTPIFGSVGTYIIDL